MFESIKDRDEYSLDEIEGLSIYSNNVYTDILAKDISKANSILELYTNINGNDLYTIGDGENDICMLEISENSYTFDSSIDSVKKSAKYIYQSIDEILDEINRV